METKETEAEGNAGIIRLMNLGAKWVHNRELSQLRPDLCMEFHTNAMDTTKCPETMQRTKHRFGVCGLGFPELK